LVLARQLHFVLLAQQQCEVFYEFDIHLIGVSLDARAN
jgi:hypothetical protein